MVSIQYYRLKLPIARVPLFILDVLVALQSACGGNCSYGVAEEAGPLTVCAEILFINGTALTTANYTVTISIDDRADGAQSKQS